MVIISQGAEAILEKKENKLFKIRTPKNYRIKEIDDSLRRSRTKREEKILKKAKELGINVPEIFESKDKYTIVMEFIDSVRLRDRIENKTAGKNELKIVGEWVAKLHDENIIHGDLTTSNILITEENKLYLIDFGLSITSQKIEDRAVDIHLLEQALESTHHEIRKELFEAFLKGYELSKTYKEVLERLNVVRSRGRNKH